MRSTIPSLLCASAALVAGELVTGGLAFTGRVAAADFPRVRHAEHFAFVRAKVPEGLGGPAREAAKSWHVSMCVAPDGTAYVLDAENCQLYRVQGGVVRVLAGDGIRGYRDGPAHRARFDFGVGSYQDADVKLDAAGRLYVSEGLPGRLRRLERDESGTWAVTTIAGGGTRMPQKGESIEAREMKVGSTSRFAVTPEGTVYFASHGGIHRVRDGRGTLLVSRDDMTAALGKVSIHDWHVGGSHITAEGWFYWMPGGGPNLYRAHVETGKVEKVAGIDKLAPGLDGETLRESGFHTVFVAYSPDASTIFTGGGDEAILRAIAGGRSAHLQKDGTFLPGGKKEGWRLYSPLCLDDAGRLYVETGIYAWGGFVARVTFEGGPAEAKDATPAAVGRPATRDRGLRRQPAGAFGKGVYLVAWSEGSRDIDRPGADILCSRVAPGTGTLLDPEGIPVCTVADLQEWPAVAFDGASFLVVWQDFRSGRHHDVYAARVTPEGNVLDPNGFAVSAGPWNEARPDVAFAGGRHLVVWMDSRAYPTYGIHAARVSPEGQVLDPEGFGVDVESEAKIAEARPPTGRWLGDRHYWWSGLASRYMPVVAASGSRCAVAYTREYPFAESGRPQPTAVLVDAAEGRVVAGPLKLPGGAYDTLDVCATGDGWTVILADHAQGWSLSPRLAAVRLTPELETSDAFAMPFSEEPDRLPVVDLKRALMPEKAQSLNPGKGAMTFWRPAAAWSGRDVVAATDFGWRDPRDPNGITYVIGLSRLEPGATAFLDDQCRAIATTERADRAVANPALVAGPPGEVLLLHEHDDGLDSHGIRARVLPALADR